jgi:hypothetical protein
MNIKVQISTIKNNKKKLILLTMFFLNQIETKGIRKFNKVPPQKENSNLILNLGFLISRNETLS